MNAARIRFCSKPMATAGIASEASTICSSAAISIPMRQARPAIRRELTQSPPRVVPAKAGTTLIFAELRADDHALVASQIERTAYFLSLPVQKCRKQNFAAEADRLRLQRNRLGSEVQRDRDRHPFALPPIEQQVALRHDRHVVARGELRQFVSQADQGLVEAENRSGVR